MPVSINGNTGVITGLAVGGLPDGTVDADTLAANAVTSGKLASGVGGKALQVLSVNKTDTTSYTGTSFADISGITLNITPQTNSKVLIQFSYAYGADNIAGGSVRIARVKSGTTTYLAVADTAGYDGVSSSITSYVGGNDHSNQIYHQAFHHLDASPGGDGSTQITYKMQWRIGSGAIYLGRDSTGSISEYAGGNEFTLTEYAA
tara:strand:+ start:1499 stop:2110 length:612 start_codon:yes stop_codon:yes gene_type:complete